MGGRIRVKSRDIHMVNIIRGVTKASVHMDWRKECDRRRCRDQYDWEEWEGETELPASGSVTPPSP